MAGLHDRPKGRRRPVEGAALVELVLAGPELNPVEHLWLYLRERHLSHRLLADHEAVVEACCAAWATLAQEPGRIQSLTSHSWLPCVRS